MSQYNPFDPLNPLQGLENIPGVDFKGADNFVTTGGLLKGVQGLATGLSKGYNPALTLGLAGTNFIGGLRDASTNLANIANTRQDIIKKGADITETGLDISRKKFDFSNDQTARNALMLYINQLPVDQQVLALTNPEEFSKTLIARTAPTGSIKEYEYAVAQGYKGSYPEYIKNIEKFRATTFNMGTEGSYAQAAGKGLFEADTAMIDQAYKQQNLNMELNVAADIISSGRAYTGALSPLKSAIGSIKNTMFKDGKFDNEVSATEFLNAITGKQVFPMIGELGIGARGLDTPAERRFLQQVMTGDPSMNPNSLIKMNIMAKRRSAFFADRYNKKIESGGFKNYEDAAKVKLDKLDMGNIVPVKGAKYRQEGKVIQVFNDGYGYYVNEDGTFNMNEKAKDDNGNIIDFVDTEYTLVSTKAPVNQPIEPQ